MRKLYYEDSNLKEFTAMVTACTGRGKSWEIILDATAFYPEGGGQACDLGMLGTAKVLDVQEKEGEVCHLCDRPLEVGSTVAGKIDWQRRFDLMQQHTGEHILSGIIHRQYGYHNVGFHVGQEVMEVDFDGILTWEQAMALEREANEMVWKNLPVLSSVPSPQELEQKVYRTKRKLAHPVRIVEIPGVDSCACCGVHTQITGQVGLIKILSCVKFHAGVRLEMVCGGRAYGYMAEIFEENRKISQLLSAKMSQSFEAVSKLSQALSQEKYKVAALQKQVFEGIANSYVNQSKVLHFTQNLEAGELRLLAEKISAAGCLAAVFSGQENRFGYCLAGDEETACALGMELNAAFQGRGGGRGGFFQGSVTASQKEIFSFLAKRGF